MGYRTLPFPAELREVGQMWYNAPVKDKGRLRSLVALVAASCMALAAVCGGRIICLCSDDPDGCCEPCHACGEEAQDGLSATESFSHFSLANVDFWIEDVDVVATAGDTPLPVVHRWTRILARRQFLMSLLPVLRANAPPGSLSDLALFRVRRVLLLS